MITLEDCIGLCGLTEEEVLAVAEHEHLPQVAATAFAQYLCYRAIMVVRSFEIVEDIQMAQHGGNKERVLTLLHVLHHFLLTHPEASGEHPWSRRYWVRTCSSQSSNRCEPASGARPLLPRICDMSVRMLW